MAILSKATALLVADTKGFNQAVDAAGRKVKDFAGDSAGHLGKTGVALEKMGISADAAGKLLKGMGVTAGVAFAAISAVAVKAIGEAGKFQTALTDMAKVTDEPLDQIRKKIQAIDPALGNSTELVKGYYQVISAGVTDPAKSLEVLKTAAMTAKTAHVEQSEVVKGITKIMAAYAKENTTAAQAADTLFAMEKAGQTSVQELIPYIGELSAKSAALGIDQTELGAAFGAVTKLAGNTAEASTQYRAVMTSLMTPSKEMTDLLGKYGGAQKAIADMGFEGVLRKIADAAGGDASELAKLMGSSEALSGVIAISANDFDAFSASMEVLEGRTGSLDQAWKNHEGTYEAVKEKFDSTIKNIMIELGETLLPVVTEELNIFAAWFQANKDPIVDFFEKLGSWLSTLTGLFGTAFGALTTLWDTMTAFPRGIIEFFFNVGQGASGASDKLTQLNIDIANMPVPEPGPWQAFWNFMGAVGTGITEIFTASLSSVGNLFGMLLKTAWDTVVAIGGSFKDLSGVIWSAMTLNTDGIVANWTSLMSRGSDLLKNSGDNYRAYSEAVDASWEKANSAVAASFSDMHGIVAETNRRNGMIVDSWIAKEQGRVDAAARSGAAVEDLTEKLKESGEVTATTKDATAAAIAATNKIAAEAAAAGKNLVAERVQAETGGYEDTVRAAERAFAAIDKASMGEYKSYADKQGQKTAAAAAANDNIKSSWGTATSLMDGITKGAVAAQKGDYGGLLTSLSGIFNNTQAAWRRYEDDRQGVTTGKNSQIKRDYQKTGADIQDNVFDKLKTGWDIYEGARKDITGIVNKWETGDYGGALSDISAAAGKYLPQVIALFGGKAVGEAAEGSTIYERIAKVGAMAGVLGGAYSAVKNAFDEGGQVAAYAAGGWLDRNPGGGPIREGSHRYDDVFLGFRGGAYNYGMGGEWIINQSDSKKQGALLDFINSGGFGNYDGMAVVKAVKEKIAKKPGGT